MATLDPLAMMAETNEQAMRELLDAMTEVLPVDLEAVLELEVPDFQPVGMEDQPRLDEITGHVTCPECGHAFNP